MCFVFREMPGMDPMCLAVDAFVCHRLGDLDFLLGGPPGYNWDSPGDIPEGLDRKRVMKNWHKSVAYLKKVGVLPDTFTKE